jgi:hypothetical protein
MRFVQYEREAASNAGLEVRHDKKFIELFSTQETGKGTGPGLRICYGIINSHKRGISVSPECRVVSPLNYVPE